jgi:Copper type II ascorbate-dependent monooxygenase, C-terminal domain
VTTKRVLLTFASLAILSAALVACGRSGDRPATSSSAVTFWQDAEPIFNARCVKCHQQGGIAPFRLDTYTDAKAYGALELARVTQGTMPPYFMVHDDSCGSFHDDGTLTDPEKQTITAWVNGGMIEGTVATLPLPAMPTLSGAVDIATPTFAPVAQGGALAAFDEYRCFLLDSPSPSDAFLTGYNVTPGEPSIVHHVLMFAVDPQAMGTDGRTNATIMQALHDASPDRPGWPCFGMAGDNVTVTGVPVTWAPGQGIVEYPAGMGFPIRATDKLVVQVHYNLADPSSAGKTDSSTVHLRFASQVDRHIAFLLPDPFLATAYNAQPDTLPPGNPDAKYTWTKTGSELGIKGFSVDLVAVMPHMHGRGIRQVMQLGTAGNLSCASHLEHWNFHWQEFYFYKTSPSLSADTQVQVTCEYDTSMDTAPVLPGWGTRNEMCLAVLMVALPPM